MNLMHPPRLDIFRPMLAIMLAAVYAVPAFESAQVAYADQSQTEAASADTHIHILPFAGTDVPFGFEVVLDANGHVCDDPPPGFDLDLSGWHGEENEES
mgnify:CR=1 FL=1